MNVYKTEDETRFIRDFLAMAGPGFLYLNRRWWVYDDGFWSQLGARDRLEHAIFKLGEQTLPEGSVLRRQLGMRYTLDRFVARLGVKLTTYQIPGRLRDDLQPE